MTKQVTPRAAFRLLGPALILVGAAAVLALSAPASASSYNGTGDWTINYTDNEVVTGETVVVQGFLHVNGTLELVNSTVVVRGRLPPFLAPPEPLREAAKVYVNGSLTLTNSTLRLYVPFGDFGGITGESFTNSSPVGLRVGGTGNVTLRDFDNDSSTPRDGSLFTADDVQAPENGSYSTFAPGSRFVMRNSRATWLGFQGFPGFEFNGSSQVDITGSVFDFSHNATVFNNCAGVLVANTTVYFVERPFLVRGGSGHRFFALNITEVTLGPEFSGASDVEVADLRIRGLIGQPLYNGWAQPGSAVTFDNVTGGRILRLKVDGNATDQSWVIRMVDARSSSNLVVADADMGRARFLGSVRSSANLNFTRITADGFAEGFTLESCSFVLFKDIRLSAFAEYALHFTGGIDATFENYTASARHPLWLTDVSSVRVDGANLNATQNGFRAEGGGTIVMRATAVTGVGTAVHLENVSFFTATAGTFEFGDNGITAAFSNDITFFSPALTTAPGFFGRRAVYLTSVRNVALHSFTFAGSCEIAAKVVTATNLRLDGFSALTCSEGIDISGAAYVNLTNIDVHGAWNGSALSISAISDVIVDDVSAYDAWGYAVAVGLSTRVQISNVDGRRGGAGGFIALASDHLELWDSDFSGSLGVAVGLFSSAGPITVTRVNASTSALGVEVLGCPGVVLADIDASSNSILGIDVDPASLRATLVNITASRNGGDGIFVGANLTVIYDGNFSHNLGDAIAGGQFVRFDWVVARAASLVNDSLHLKGNLTVQAGATFDAVSSLIRVDEGTSIIDPLPSGRLTLHGTVLFDRLHLRGVNQTRPHGVLASASSSLLITNSTLEGAARGDALSAFDAQGALTVLDSSFSGWSSPLVGNGATALLRRSTFANNSAGPTLLFGTAELEDITSADNDGIGLNLQGLSGATLVRYTARANSGLGLLGDGVSALVIRGATLNANLQGAASFHACDLDIASLYATSNLGFALRIDSGVRSLLRDIHLSGNSGWGLHASLGPLDISDLWVDHNGGNALELYGPLEATLRGGAITDGSAAGIWAQDAAVAVEGTVFRNNAGPQFWLLGTATLNATNVTLRDSALDTALVTGGARLHVLQARVEGLAGRIHTRDQAYAYSLNSSFSGFAADDASSIDVAWDLRVIVLLGTASPAVGAAAELFNASGASLARTLVDSDGVRFFPAVLQATFLSGGRSDSRTPHRAAAELPGAGLARRNFTLEAYTEVVLRLDGAPPTVSLTLEGLEGEAGWYLGPVTATLEASDGGGSGLAILWRLAGGPWFRYDTALDFGATSFIVDTEGDTLLEYTAEDGAGNLAAPASVHLLVDLAPPTALWLVDASTLRGRTLLLAWGGFDGNGSGIASLAVSVSYQGGPPTLLASGAQNGTTEFTGREGDYAFHLTATDFAGRSSGLVLLQGDIVTTGTLRIAVRGPDGLPLPTATVEVVGANQSQAGAGILTFRLPEGHYDLVVRAPGFAERRLTANVALGNTTELGEVRLDALPVQETGAGTTLLIGALAAAAAAAVVLLALMRRRKGPAVEDEFEKVP